MSNISVQLDKIGVDKYIYIFGRLRKVKITGYNHKVLSSTEERQGIPVGVIRQSFEYTINYPGAENEFFIDSDFYDSPQEFIDKVVN